jgi:hypothetical protein
MTLTDITAATNGALPDVPDPHAAAGQRSR